MKRMMILGVLHLLAVAIFAAEPVEIRAKEGVDFSSYETYAWTSHEYLDKDSPLREGAALDQRIRGAADKLMEGRGFQRVEREESPDLMINYVGLSDDYFQAEGITKEIAPGVKWIGDVNAHSMRSYREGTLVFEVLDTGTDEMVWSGWVTELAPSVEKLQAKAEKATRKVFKHFPSK
jgi:hypothetical protein